MIAGAQALRANGTMRSMSSRSGFPALRMLMGVIVAVTAILIAPAWARKDSTDLEHKIDAMVGELMEAAKVPGVSVIVEKGNKTLLAKGYGIADLEHNIPVSRDTVFAIGSITKQFTGLAIAQLVEAGELSLDDEVGELLPEIVGAPAKLTVAELLTHTNGLKNYTAVPELHKRAWERHSHADMLAYFINEPLGFEPGTRWAYTNSGIYLLGMIIEAKSGQSYEDYIREHIFKPFGLSHTYYGDSKTIIPNRAQGYELNSNGDWANARGYDASVPYSAGTLLSTPSDLAKYAKAVLKGESISDAAHEFITTQGRLESGTVLSYTDGCIFSTDFYGHAKLAHAGEIYGNYAQLAYYPDSDLTIAVLTNRQNYQPSPVGLERKIARAVLGIPQPDSVSVELDAGIIERVSGHYTSLPLTFFSLDRIAISVKDGVLLLAIGSDHPSEDAWPFRFVGDGRFVAVFDDEVTIELPADANKSDVLLRFYDQEMPLSRLD